MANCPSFLRLAQRLIRKTCPNKIVITCVAARLSVSGWTLGFCFLNQTYRHSVVYLVVVFTVDDDVSVSKLILSIPCSSQHGITWVLYKKTTLFDLQKLFFVMYIHVIFKFLMLTTMPTSPYPILHFPAGCSVLASPFTMQLSNSGSWAKFGLQCNYSQPQSQYQFTPRANPPV